MYHLSVKIPKSLSKRTRADVTRISTDDLCMLVVEHGDVMLRRMCYTELVRRRDATPQSVATTVLTPVVASRPSTPALQPTGTRCVSVVCVDDLYNITSGETIIVHKSTGIGSRRCFDALMHAIDTYGPEYVYYVDSEYIYNVFNLYIETWECNGYMTKAGAPVKNRDLIKALRTKGLGARNVRMYNG